MKTNIYFDLPSERAIAMAVEPSQALIFGLEEQLAADLARVLSPNHEGDDLPGDSEPSDISDALRNNQVDIIFCSSEARYCRPVLDAVKKLRPHVPVVVVSAEPEFAEWHEAMEAGAADFCAAPFEASQIHLILSSHLSSGSAVS